MRLVGMGGWMTSLKWTLFRCLEAAIDRRSGQAASMPTLPAASATPSLWVYVSTIGELNAIDPFLRELATRVPHLRMVLITDHAHYEASYRALYPKAEIFVTRGLGAEGRHLARRAPPAMLVVAEIPCRPFDAPCRFSFGFVHEALRHRARTMIVNGWLYQYEPNCRSDSIEYALFHRDYLRAFDTLCVQTTGVRDSLVAAGAPADRVVVAGNIKFDAMVRKAWRIDEAKSATLLRSIVAAGRFTIVAGCLTRVEEQAMLIEAFARLRQRHPGSLLVLAPRHPEVAQNLRDLRDGLDQHGLASVFRSELGNVALPEGTACIVLDTMGDLRDFYAAATVAHVGVDHNVLEPLGFDKPVSVMPGWVSTYPSYPVYRLLMDRHALTEVATADDIFAHWSGALDDPAALARLVASCGVALEQQRGAVHRHLQAVSVSIDAASREMPMKATAQAVRG